MFFLFFLTWLTIPLYLHDALLFSLNWAWRPKCPFDLSGRVEHLATQRFKRKTHKAWDLRCVKNKRSGGLRTQIMYSILVMFNWSIEHNTAVL